MMKRKALLKDKQDRVLELVDRVEDPEHLPQEPTVSVLMATYDHEPFIRKALDSVLMQKTSFSYEILVREDHSTDRTREILLEYQAAHPGKFRLWLAKENLYSQGLVLGLVNYARGTYLARLEGDDYWTDPLKLEKQVKVLEADPTCSLCCHRSMTLRKDKLEPSSLPTGIDLERITLEDIVGHDTFIMMASVMYRRALLPMPPWTRMVPVGDLALFCHAATRGNIRCIDEAMSVYRHSGSGAWTGLKPEARITRRLKIFGALRPHLGPRAAAILDRRRTDLLEKVAEWRYPRASLRWAIYLKYLQWTR